MRLQEHGETARVLPVPTSGPYRGIGGLLVHREMVGLRHAVIREDSLEQSSVDPSTAGRPPEVTAGALDDRSSGAMTRALALAMARARCASIHPARR